MIAAAAFAPGRFGADVGAAIVLAAGAATAASLSLGLSVRRTILAVIAAGVVGVLALVAVDELFGGAHFSRSVLGAGEATDVADVFERRLDLMVHTFTHPVYPELLVLTGLVLIVGLVRSAAILGWFGDRWPVRNGYVGAVVGVLIGTIANDSGSVLLVIGTIYLAAVRRIRVGIASRCRLAAPLGSARMGTLDRCASPSFRPIPGPIRGA